MSNLNMWNTMQKTDPCYTKSAKVKGRMDIDNELAEIQENFYGAIVNFYDLDVNNFKLSEVK